MDLAQDNSRYVTTIQIPVSLRAEIKAKGMTISGALIQGWAAISERLLLREDLELARAVGERQRSELKSIRLRLSELESRS